MRRLVLFSAAVVVAVAAAGYGLATSSARRKARVMPLGPPSSSSPAAEAQAPPPAPPLGAVFAGLAALRASIAEGDELPEPAIVEPPEATRGGRPLPAFFETFGFVQRRILAPADALVPAAKRGCKDAIAGTWVSREYFAAQRDWYRQELRIHRAGARSPALVGEIVARSWSGGEGDASPRACSDDAFDWTVRMQASGRVDGLRVEFRGLSLRVDTARCGEAPAPTAYSLDKFEGWLLDDRAHFVAYNDDGARAERERHVFRRVACE